MDTLELYRWAVQDPETHAVVLSTMYERLRPGRQPVVLREEFAGTSAESVAWVALKNGRRAIAVDCDNLTIEWARRRAARLLGTRAPEVTFVCGDVRQTGSPEVPHADILSVLNYSILYLRDSAELVSYLRHAFDVLAPEGILVLNVFGGEKAVQPGTTQYRVTPAPRLPWEAPIPPFEYFWEVRHYDQESQRLDCRIHFTAPDRMAPGSVQEIRDAFHYEWRLWSVQELVAACIAAGFPDVQVWRHTCDLSKGEDGVFLGSVDPDSFSALESWTAYIVAGR